MIRNPYRDTLESRSFWFAQHQLEIQQNPNNRLVHTGNVVWDGAIVFCKFLEKMPADYFLGGKKFIELGKRNSYNHKNYLYNHF